MSLHYNSDNSYLFVNGKEIYKFKASNKNDNFPSHFCLGNISNKFDFRWFKRSTLLKKIYDFSVDYDAIDKYNVSNIHRYLMIKYSI